MRYKNLVILIIILLFLSIFLQDLRAIGIYTNTGVINALNLFGTGFIKDIKEIDEDNIVVATAKGSFLISSKGNIKKTLTTNFSTSIALTEDYIIIGTTKGILLISRKKEETILIRKEQGLPDDFITDVEVEGDILWIATKFLGVITYNLKTKVLSKKTYTVLDGLADNSINDIDISGDGVWIATPKGLSFLDKSLGSVITYGEEEGLVGEILCVKADGEYVWIGTPTGLFIFNRSTESFKKVQGIEDMVQKIVVDGDNVFCGTFGGLYLVNRNNFNVEKAGGGIEFSWNSVGALEIGMNYIYIGSDEPLEGQILIYKRPIPYVSIANSSGFVKQNSYNLYGIVYYSAGISSISVEYKPLTLKGIDWNTKGIKVNKVNSKAVSLLAEWNTKGLIDDVYIIRLRVVGEDGRENIAYHTAIVDTRAPVLKLNPFPLFTSESKFVISGSFEEGALKDIYAELKGSIFHADVDLLRKTFSINILLNEGENEIKIVASDNNYNLTIIPLKISLNTKGPTLEFPEKLEASTLPFTLRGKVVSKYLENVIIEELGKRLSLKKESEGTYIIEENIQDLKPGKNTFTIVALDTFGNKTVKKLEITYNYTGPQIILEDFPKEVQIDKVEIKGKLLPQKNTYLVLYPGNKSIEVDSAGNFSITLELNAGENVFKLSAWDEQGNTTSKLISIVYKPIITTEAGDGKYYKLYMEEKAKREMLENRVSLLENRIKELEELLKKEKPQRTQEVPLPQERVVYVPKEVSIEYLLNNTIGMFLVDFSLEEGDNFWKISRKYYNTENFAYIISTLNDEEGVRLIETKRKLLIPSRKLIRLLLEYGPKFFDVVDAISNYYSGVLLGDTRKFEDILKRKNLNYKVLGANVFLVEEFLINLSGGEIFYKPAKVLLNIKMEKNGIYLYVREV